MSREPEREEFEKWLSKRSMQLFPTEPCLKTDISGRSSEVDLAIQIRAKAEKLAREAHAAGERLGREDSDSVYWPALREQWRIEFGRELQQQGGRIMNVIDGVRELVREEREKVIADFRTVRPNI